jgi:O-antigen ligase
MAIQAELSPQRTSPARQKFGFAAGTLGVFVLTVPWLNPFATGPSSAVIPWLTSLVCWAVWLLLRPLVAERAAEPMARAWLVAALVSTVFGLLQYFAAAATFSPWINGTLPGTAFANLRQRNQFATLTNMGLAALAWAVVRHHQCRAWHWAAALTLATGNAASSSRTGLLELVLLVALASVWRGWRQSSARQLVLLALFGYAVATVVLPMVAGYHFNATGILARMDDDAPACFSRRVLWANVLELAYQKPWFGWGWGELDYAHFMASYAGPRFCDILDNAHNLPLHLAVELGVPVAALACGWGAWFIWRARPLREANPDRQMAWVVLALILLHSMLEYPLWYGPFQIAFGLCAWHLWSTRPTPHEGSGIDKQTRSPAVVLVSEVGWISRPGVAATAFVLLVAAAYAAWDYHRVSQLYLATSQRAPAYRDNTFEKVKGTWLFARQVRFAELTTTEVTPDNAAMINAMAHELLHFSPEARVVEKLIESAELLGRDEEVQVFLARYQAAFPAAHAVWVKTRAPP